MAGTSFTNQGATPYASTKPMASPFNNAPKTAANPLAGNTGASNALNSFSGFISPTTPTKSVTVSHPDGSTITQSFHPETTGTTKGLIDKKSSGASGSWEGGTTNGIVNNQQPQNTGLTEQQVRDNITKSGYVAPIQSTQTPQTPQKTDTQEQVNRNAGVTPETPIVSTTGGIPNNTGVYGQLVGKGVENINQAAQVGGEAGRLREAMQRETRDVMGNPYYSGSVKTGQAANIAQQQGSQLQGLSAEQQALTGQGNAYLAGAGADSTINQAGVVVDRITGKPIVGNSSDLNNIITQGAGYDARVNQSAAYQQGLKNLRSADAIQNNIVGTLSQNPNLNQTPISAITNLKQWFAGQTSDPAQQVLSQQVANYIQALGMSPDQAATIASQKGGTIATLLENLRQTFENQNNANLGSPANSGENTKGSSNSYVSPSGTTYNLPY